MSRRDQYTAAYKNDSGASPLHGTASDRNGIGKKRPAQSGKRTAAQKLAALEAEMLIMPPDLAPMYTNNLVKLRKEVQAERHQVLLIISVL
jgi:hypothetical protein